MRGVLLLPAPMINGALHHNFYMYVQASDIQPCVSFRFVSLSCPLLSSRIIIRLLAAQGGGLGCNWAETRVMSLAWNDEDGVLYIGGEAEAGVVYTQQIHTHRHNICKHF